MATPLKDRLNPAALAALEARFGLPGLASAVGDDDLELLERAARWASAIAARLPRGALGLHAFIKALEAPLDVDAMVYLVHGRLLMILQGDVAAADVDLDIDIDNDLDLDLDDDLDIDNDDDLDDDLDLAVAANVALTERFTAEFALRPLLARHPERMLAHLQALARSTNEHHRRLVSEATRPRLPWAPRQPMLQAIAAPVDELLIMLSDDPALYVRRSVANHLGDIAKDDLDRALALCARVAHPWVRRHALRHPPPSTSSAPFPPRESGVEQTP